MKYFLHICVIIKKLRFLLLITDFMIKNIYFNQNNFNFKKNKKKF